MRFHDFFIPIFKKINFDCAFVKVKVKNQLHKSNSSNGFPNSESQIIVNQSGMLSIVFKFKLVDLMKCYNFEMFKNRIENI